MEFRELKAVTLDDMSKEVRREERLKPNTRSWSDEEKPARGQTEQVKQKGHQEREVPETKRRRSSRETMRSHGQSPDRSSK